MSFLQVYILLQYYLNQTSLNFEKFKSGKQSKTQITLYEQVTNKDQELSLLKKQT